jgi:hypothetical protein
LGHEGSERINVSRQGVSYLGSRFLKRGCILPSSSLTCAYAFFSFCLHHGTTQQEGPPQIQGPVPSLCSHKLICSLQNTQYQVFCYSDSVYLSPTPRWKKLISESCGCILRTGSRQRSNTFFPMYRDEGNLRDSRCFTCSSHLQLQSLPSLRGAGKVFSRCGTQRGQILSIVTKPMHCNTPCLDAEPSTGMLSYPEDSSKNYQWDCH